MMSRAHLRCDAAISQGDCKVRRQVHSYLILLHVPHSLCPSQPLVTHGSNFQIHLRDVHFLQSRVDAPVLLKAFFASMQAPHLAI